MAGFLAAAADAAGPGMWFSSHAYGNVDRQTIDLYRPKAHAAAPLLLFIHGGGWSAGSKAEGERGQQAHFTSEGLAWGTIGYRLVPTITVEQQASDIAQAIGWLHRHAHKLNLDDRRLILIGHSSGAHLAALVATDPQWLKAAHVPFDLLAGVVSLDGAGIDVPGIMAAGAASSPFYAGAFGDDVARQARLSPSTHIGPPDAPHWLFLYDRDHNESAGWFAQRFAEKAQAAAVTVRVVPLTGTTHMKMLNALGTPGDAATVVLDEFIRQISGRGQRQ